MVPPKALLKFVPKVFHEVLNYTLMDIRIDEYSGVCDQVRKHTLLGYFVGWIFPKAIIAWVK
jgi:hypothetical protein